MKKYIFSTGLLMLACGFATAQQHYDQSLVSATGAHYSANGIQMSMSIGEVIVATEISNGITLTQGFHQPNAIPKTTAVANNSMRYEAVNDELSLFPNPNHGAFHLQYVAIDAQRLTCIMRDINGRLITESTFNCTSGTQQWYFDFPDLNKGIYFMEISSTGKRDVLKIIIE